MRQQRSLVPGAVQGFNNVDKPLGLAAPNLGADPAMSNVIAF